MAGIIKHIAFKEVRRPFRTTFATSLGKKDMLASVLVTVTLDDGSSGIGECPTSFVQKHETVATIKRVLREASSFLTGSPVSAQQEKVSTLRKRYREYPLTLSGLEVALLRAYLHNSGVDEHTWFGGRTADVETDITIPFLTDEAALGRWMKYIVSKEFRVFKLKVSGRIDEDRKLLSRVYRTLTENCEVFTLRIDGNQGYTQMTYPRIIEFIVKNGFAVELFEQPLPKDDIKGLKKIRQYSPVPVILDETVFTGDHLVRALDEDLCDGINIKIAKSGVYESLKMLAMARKAGIKLMIGCMTETMTGLSAGIFLAAGTGSFDYVDLDAIHFLYHKNLYGNIWIDGPRFCIR